MKKRIITAVIAIALFIPVCIFSDTYVLPAAFALLSAVAVWEIWHCVHTAASVGSPFLYLPFYLLAVVGPFLPMCISDWQTAYLVLFAGNFVALLYVFVVAVFSRGKFPPEHLFLIFTMCLYVNLSLSTVVFLRRMNQGEYLYLLAFIGPWVSDTFAYFCGRAFGKHKLIPEVSPKKTVEGSIGGIVFAALAFVLTGFIVGKCDPAVAPSYVVLAIAGAVISVISQVGDLIASVVKRRYGIKDYGWLLPGHGGVLDRFDSVLAALPVLFLLSLVYPLL